MNRLVENAPLGDWWLPLALLILGVAIALMNWFEMRGMKEEVEEAPAELAGLIVAEGKAEMTPIPEFKAPPAAEAAPVAQPPPAKVEAWAPAVEVTPPGTPAPMKAEAPAPAAKAPPAKKSAPAQTEAPSAAPPPAPPEPPPAAEKPARTRAKAAPPAPPAPAAKPDDLTIIEGIGPRIDGALKVAGIDTLAKLSKASNKELEAAIAASNIRLAPSLPTWAEQATYLITGDQAGFDSLVRQLKAGRRAGSKS